MDSLTQAVLGAAVAAAPLPAHQRRRGLVAGVLLGTLPDLDVFVIPWLSSSAVDMLVWHRGPSHALWLLALVGLLIWGIGWRLSSSVRQAPKAWLLGIMLALLTHPILDAFTIYGTQLWWPSSRPPEAWGSVFIIDPLYTLPLLLAVLAAFAGGARRWVRPVLLCGIALSSLYLAWSLLARAHIEQAIAPELQRHGLADAPLLVLNTPGNTLLWRVVVMQPDGYAVGYRSIFDGGTPFELEHFPRESELTRQIASESSDVQRLLWFNRGFAAARIMEQGRYLVLEDLRMGSERSGYTFGFRIAENTAGPGMPPHWQALPRATQQPRDADFRQQMLRDAIWSWQRISSSTAPQPSAAPGSAAAER